MSFQATAYRVMIATPSDVEDKAGIVEEEIGRWNAVHAEPSGIVLLPVRSKSHSYPSVGDGPQAVLNAQLKDCDVLIAVFWSRIGTPTKEYQSGSVEEIERHIHLNKPVMLFFSGENIPQRRLADNQYRKLTKYRRQCQSRAYYHEYMNDDDFRRDVYTCLEHLVNNHAHFKQPSHPATSTVADHGPGEISGMLSDEAKQLLKAASRQDAGRIMRVELGMKLDIWVGSQHFVKEDDLRAKALFDDAIEQLEYNELICDTSLTRRIFTVTKKGYDVADLMAHSQDGMS